MIEFINAKSGEQIFKYEGKHLCSSYDPAIEARRWYDKNVHRLRYCDTVIVLGAGCGFHIKELTQNLPQLQIVVLDSKMEVVERCKLLHSLAIAHVKFVVKKESQDLFSNKILNSAIKTNYTIVRFSQANVLSPVFFNEAELLLTARNIAGYNAVINLRDDLKHIEKISETDLYEITAKPLTIKSIKYDRTTGPSEIEWASINILLELVV